MRVLVTGAAGSGTSTLGKFLASCLGGTFQDADDIYWLPTSPPFQCKRAFDERFEAMRQVIAANSILVVAGSVMRWGAEIEDGFDLIIFLTAPTDIRIKRIREREMQRYGAVDESFLRWAAQYETGSLAGRSLARHNAWLAERACPVTRLCSTAPPEELARAALDSAGWGKALSDNSPRGWGVRLSGVTTLCRA